VFTLPTLKLVELGPLAKVPMAYGGHAAPNITSLCLGVKEGEFGGISHIFSRLPNLRSLKLLSYCNLARGAYEPFYALGNCTVEDIYTLLNAIPGLEELAIACISSPQGCDRERHCPNLSRYPQLRQLEMTEDAFSGGADTERPTNSAPVDLLPHNIQSIVITRAILRSSEFPHRRLRILSWLDELNKANFPELHRIEVFYDDNWRYRSRGGFGEEQVIKIMDAYEASVPMKQLRAAGVELVLRTH
jgi:hypothetical protein